jgi:hypothetical protein
MLLVLFLAIIPAVVRDLVDQADLVILQVTIINPNDVSFKSEVSTTTAVAATAATAASATATTTAATATAAATSLINKIHI